MVARAPGRLDVMGGIADYSGSRVLQLPLAQACHVACQLHPPDKQPVWRHVAHRHAKSGELPLPGHPQANQTDSAALMTAMALWLIC